MTTHSFAEK